MSNGELRNAELLSESPGEDELGGTDGLAALGEEWKVVSKRGKDQGVVIGGFRGLLEEHATVTTCSLRLDL